MTGRQEARVVLDASGVLALLLDERGADTVAKLLPHAIVPAPNLTETLYMARRRGHRMGLQELHDHVLALGLTVEPYTDADAVRGAELHAYSDDHPSPDGSRLSLGDACCLAVAERLELPVAGDDRAWAALPLAVRFHRFR